MSKEQANHGQAVTEHGKDRGHCLHVMGNGTAAGGEGISMF